jgi:hypothetical protein
MEHYDHHERVSRGALGVQYPFFIWDLFINSKGLAFKRKNRVKKIDFENVERFELKKIMIIETIVVTYREKEKKKTEIFASTQGWFRVNNLRTGVIFDALHTGDFSSFRNPNLLEKRKKKHRVGSCGSIGGGICGLVIGVIIAGLLTGVTGYNLTGLGIAIVFICAALGNRLAKKFF